jgi:hypothetical protein
MVKAGLEAAFLHIKAMHGIPLNTPFCHRQLSQPPEVLQQGFQMANEVIRKRVLPVVFTLKKSVVLTCDYTRTPSTRPSTSTPSP